MPDIHVLPMRRDVAKTTQELVAIVHIEAVGIDGQRNTVLETKKKSRVKSPARSLRC